MIRISKNSPVKSTLQAASLATLVLMYTPGSHGFWSASGWAQEIRHAQRPLVPPRTSQPAASVPAPIIPPVGEPAGGTLGSALANCDKESQASEGLMLPGAKSDFKLDRCYRGRDHFVCGFNALLNEAKSLLKDYKRVVEARYPDVGNVGDICKIMPDSLAANMQNAADFANRFKALKAEYDARISCANKIGQSLKDVTLPDLAQAPGILKSMIDAVEGDVKGVSVEEAKVAELAEKIDGSRKAMVMIRKIHRSMCLQGQQLAPQQERAGR